MDKPESGAGSKRKADGKDQGAEKKRAKSNYSDTATVLVGDDETSFVVYRDLVCARSKFIAAALSKAWNENNTKQVRLVGQEPCAFKIYLEALYDGKANLLDLATAHVDELGDLRKVETSAVGRVLCKLWTLGDFLEDTIFRNSVISSLLRGIQDKKAIISPRTAHYVWENVPSISSLGRLTTDWICSSLPLDMEFLDKNADKMPSDYRLVYLRYFVQRSKGVIRKRDLLRAKDAEKYCEKWVTLPAPATKDAAGSS